METADLVTDVAEVVTLPETVPSTPASVAMGGSRRGHMAWECVEGVTCSKCGEKGHLQRNCKNVSCHKCGRKGHIAKFCNDPFAKAAEVEKHERQQALLVARTVVSASQTVSDMGSTLTRGMAIGTNQKETPGPWDGLGVSSVRDHGPSDTERAIVNDCSGGGHKTEARSSLLSGLRKRTASNALQAVMSQRVRILGIKRRETRHVSQVLHSEGLTEDENAACNADDRPLEAGSVEPQWRGLVGYESEGSEAGDISLDFSSVSRLDDGSDKQESESSPSKAEALSLKAHPPHLECSNQGHTSECQVDLERNSVSTNNVKIDLDK